LPAVGAWGEGPFDNDVAGDWSYDFEGLDAQEGFGMLTAALSIGAPRRRGLPWKRPRDDAGYLDADEGSVAVAAAEVVAYLADRAPPAPVYGEDAYAWADRTAASADVELVRLALAALDRVTGEGSELADLWDESDGAGWRASVDSIRHRLAASIS
jgi:Domain of unknown function (DUF4259)